MIFTETSLRGAYIIEPELHHDERGFFTRSFCVNEFAAYGLNSLVAQCNISFNEKRGTLRGMHYQWPAGEVKLVRCTRGKLYDVIVDLRLTSPTYCKFIGVELTSENRKMLYVPAEFAHGFLTLENDTEIFYQMSEFYIPGQAQGMRWDDPAIGIDWPESLQIISDRDKNYPDFKP